MTYSREKMIDLDIDGWAGGESPEPLHVVFNIPKDKSKLKITPTLHVYSSKKYPNWFHRFWYWALLGWTWEKLDG